MADEDTIDPTLLPHQPNVPRPPSFSFNFSGSTTTSPSFSFASGGANPATLAGRVRSSAPPQPPQALAGDDGPVIGWRPQRVPKTQKPKNGDLPAQNAGQAGSGEQLKDSGVGTDPANLPQPLGTASQDYNKLLHKNLDKENQRLEQKVKTLEHEISQRALAVVNEKTAFLQQKIAEDEEVQKRKRITDKLIAELQKRNGDLQTMNSNLQQAAEERFAQWKLDADNSIAQLQNKNGDLQRATEEGNNTIAELEASNNDLRIQLHNTSQDRTRWQQEAESRRHQLTTAEDELNTSNNNVSGLRHQLQVLLDSRDSVIKDRLKTTSDELRQTSEQRDSAQYQLHDLQEALKSRDQDISTFVESKQQAQAQFDALWKDHQACINVDELTRELNRALESAAEAHRENANRREELEQKDKELAQMSAGSRPRSLSMELSAVEESDGVHTPILTSLLAKSKIISVSVEPIAHGHPPRGLLGTDATTQTDEQIHTDLTRGHPPRSFSRSPIISHSTGPISPPSTPRHPPRSFTRRDPATPTLAEIRTRRIPRQAPTSLPGKDAHTQTDEQIRTDITRKIQHSSFSRSEVLTQSIEPVASAKDEITPPKAPFLSRSKVLKEWIEPVAAAVKPVPPPTPTVTFYKVVEIPPTEAATPSPPKAATPSPIEAATPSSIRAATPSSIKAATPSSPKAATPSTPIFLWFLLSIFVFFLIAILNGILTGGPYGGRNMPGYNPGGNFGYDIDDGSWKIWWLKIVLAAYYGETGPDRLARVMYRQSYGGRF